MFYLSKDFFILILGAKEKAPHYLFEQVHVPDLVPLSGGITYGLVEENFEIYFLIGRNSGCHNVLLCELGFGNIGGLIVGDEIQVEEQLVELVVGAEGFSRFARGVGVG